MTVLCVVLAVACGYDYKDNRIPNALVLLEAFLGVGWRFGSGGAPGALSYLGQAIFIMALLYPFFKIGGLGAGDVKLLGVTAGYLPIGKNLIFLFYSLLIAAIISIVKMWKKKCFKERILRLMAYLGSVLKEGSWMRYRTEGTDGSPVGICLSGPIFISILLYLGGVY